MFVIISVLPNFIDILFKVLGFTFTFCNNIKFLKMFVIMSVLPNFIDILVEILGLTGINTGEYIAPKMCNSY